MDSRARAPAGRRSYEDFEPPFEWVPEEGCDTLLVDLSGFKKEQLKVQMDNYGNLKITGERPLGNGDNRWSRFRKDLRIPENCNVSEIQAKIEDGLLYVIMPQLVKHHPAAQAQETPATQKTEEPPKATTTTTLPAATAAKKPTDQNSTEPVDAKKDMQRKTLEKGKEQVEDTRKADISTTVGKPKPTDGQLTDAIKDTHEKGKKQVEDTGEAAADETEEGGPMVDDTKKTPKAPDMAEKLTRNERSSPERLVDGAEGLAVGLDRPGQLVVNVLVAIMVLVGLAIYVAYRFK